ncbi:MAG: pitrilysin family protein [Rikenellaceae bacterium]
MEFYTYQLPNGIKGIHRQTRSGVTHCALLINSGTRDEGVGEYGLAHYAEHALFKGTTHRKAYQINCRLENLGGELNAFTTKEDTTIHATTLRGDFMKAVEIIADVAFNSIYPDLEMEREKEVIYEEINTYKDTPSELIYDTFEEMMFEGSELGHNILGVKKDIKRFTGDTIRDFTRRTYTTDQMVFSSIGNVSLKRVEAIANKYFGDLASSTRSFCREESRVVDRFERVVSKRTHQTHSMLGGVAYGIKDPKRLPLSLLINILGGPSANSLLNMIVREKHGLTYNIEATYTPYTDNGIWNVYFGAENGAREKALELIHAQMDRLCVEPLTQRQLSIAKRQFVAQLAISMESNEGYMLGAGKSFLVHGDVDTTEEIYRKVAALTADDIMEVASEIFKERSMLIYK